MIEQFEFAAGSVPGRRHVGSGNLLFGKNNQDSYRILSDATYLIATVHDGCGSCEHSEVGAKIGSQIISSLLRQAVLSGALDQIKNAGDEEPVFESIRQDFLTRLQKIVEQLSVTQNRENLTATIREYFLFTTVGAVLTPEKLFMFSIGDGVYALNGQIYQVGPFADNAPPYLSKALLDNDAQLKFSLHEVADTTKVNSLLIGTDGVLDLIRQQQKKVPGKLHCAGPLKQLWEDDRFFQDGGSELISPWLRQLNSEVVRLVPNDNGPALRREYGLLPDDTTIVVLRRRKEVSEQWTYSSIKPELDLTRET